MLEILMHVPDRTQGPVKRVAIVGVDVVEGLENRHDLAGNRVFTLKEVCHDMNDIEVLIEVEHTLTKQISQCGGLVLEDIHQGGV